MHSSTSHPRRSRALAEVAALWHLAWPILVGNLAVVGMSVADVAMSGNASAQDLAGVSLGVSIWYIVMVTAKGITMSISPVVAHQVGAKEFSHIPSSVRQALWKALGVGLAGSAAMLAAAGIFDHLTLEAEVRRIAQQFTYISALGMPAFAAYSVLYGYSAAMGKTKPMMVVALGALLLNVFINWLTVFGHWGMPRLGGLGCAWATMACVWFNLLALIAWMVRDKAYHSTWPLARFEPPHWASIAKLLRIGLPIGITFFAETSAFSLIALLVAEFGTRQVAAHQIALNYSSLMFMMPLSLGIATLTRVGQAQGAGNPVAARYRAWVGVAAALACAAGSAVFTVAANHWIASLYTHDLAVAALAANLLLFAALFQIPDAVQVSTSNALRGFKATRVPMFIHLTAFWVLCLPLGCVLGLAPAWFPWHPAQPMAAQGFWIALVAGLCVAALLLSSLLRVVARERVREHTLGEGATATD